MFNSPLHPLFFTDFYKVCHFEQYPKGTQTVYSNLTPRKINEPYEYAVFYGWQYFKKYYLDIEQWRAIDAEPYRKFMSEKLGIDRSFKHLELLKNYIEVNNKLPITIKALPELTKVIDKVPMMFFYNNHDEFYWFTNYIETIMSSVMWRASMSATIASHFRDLVESYALQTCNEVDEIALNYQCHDFSFRGQHSPEAAIISGLAHLQYFSGTDTIPAIAVYDELYNDKSRIASIPATEHSVMCAHGKENELKTFEFLIKNVYKTGLISIVSDTWDFWNVIANTLPALKDDILDRNGKVVIRPDSGDPVKIICGDPDADNKLEKMGLIAALVDIFGGTLNSKGFLHLNQKIGVIYGDGISLQKARQILEGLKEKGYASTNIVFGIGSYSYCYNTRDTLGFAIKSTAIQKDNKIIPIQKAPKTDDGTKVSAKGLLTVPNVRDEKGILQCVSEHSSFASDNPNDYLDGTVDDQLIKVY